MSISLYMDQHVPKAIKDGLRLRGVDCITALEDNAATMDDPDLLDRATALGRALVTSDKDFLVEADKRQTMGAEFAGIICTHPLRVSVRPCIDDLEVITKVRNPRNWPIECSSCRCDCLFGHARKLEPNNSRVRKPYAKNLRTSRQWKQAQNRCRHGSKPAQRLA